MKLRLKDVLLVFYIIISVLLFVNFKCNVFVWLSFFINFAVISLIVWHHLYIDRYYSPFISAYIVFSYLFFLMAPIIQVGSFTSSENTFATKFPYSVELTLKANGLIFMFNIVFFVFYLIFKKRDRRQLEEITVAKKSKILPLTILVLLIISLGMFVFSYDFIIDEIARPGWKKSTYSVSSLLIYKKVLFLIPFAAIILCVQYFKTQKKITTNTLIILGVLFIMVLMLLWFKNPLTEKRNALGPIYIGLIFLTFPKLLNSNIKSLSFLFFSMIVLFPLTQVITHIDYSLSAIIDKPALLAESFTKTGFVTTFNTLNYDAFSNISATIEYVSVYGFSYGYQLLSGLLFFVPRAIWQSKPISTGQLIGDYIIEEHNFNYDNLSNPFLSEGFINFSFFGVVLFAILLAYFIVKLLAWFNGQDYLKRMMAFYFAIHLVFFLRGDFTNGFAYYIGTIVGVLIIPKIINKFILFIFEDKLA